MFEIHFFLESQSHIVTFETHLKVKQDDITIFPEFN